MHRDATFEQIVHAHHALRRFAEEAREVGDISDLAAQVEEVARVLPEHFAHEERPDSFLDRIRRVHRNGDAIADQLMAEHRAFLADLPALVEAVRDGAPDALDRARAFARRLTAHERTEASLGLSPD